MRADDPIYIRAVREVDMSYQNMSYPAWCSLWESVRQLGPRMLRAAEIKYLDERAEERYQALLKEQSKGG